MASTGWNQSKSRVQQNPELKIQLALSSLWSSSIQLYSLVIAVSSASPAILHQSVQFSSTAAMNSIRVLILLGAVFALVSSGSCQLCVAETNNARAANGGLPALQNNARLVAAAKAHNDRMIASNCFDHQCSGESDLGTRVSNAGYSWGAIAENIAAGSSDCPSTVSLWMNSPGHRGNILGPYKDMGCAMGTCSSCQFKTYWTCVYGRPL